MNYLKSEDNNINNLEYVDPEIWKDIEGYEGIYEVSNKGRVKSYHGKGRILKNNLSSSGYYNVNLSKNNNQKSHDIHRLVAEHFIPNPENKPEINHKNGNKLDNRGKNLEWATASENALHAFANGLRKPSRKQIEITREMFSGEKNHNSKLKKKDIKKIKTLYSEGHTQKEISKMFDVTRSCIGYVVNNKTWR